MLEPTRFVRQGDVELAVYTWGDPPTPERPREVVVLTHGFPDRAILWEHVAHALQSACYVVAYDMRGCGRSTPIRGASHYRYEPLIADLFAVIDAISPTQKVHLAGHDWGGIYGWNAIAAPRGQQRIASFTTLSPSVEQIGFYLRRRLLRPTPRHLAQLLAQLLRNSLMTFFVLPLLPEALFRSGLGVALMRGMVEHFEGITFQKNDGVEGDAIRYLGIYRANLLQRALLPRRLVTTVPVHALMATRDPFLPPAVFENSQADAARYSSSQVDASHWAPLSQSDHVAAVILGVARANAQR
jgi:pimeloyl-ACP methyl ester carboxylesterase